MPSLLPDMARKPAWRWVALALIVAAGWLVVFHTTGLLWWGAEAPYEARPEPPEPLMAPLSGFDGVEPPVEAQSALRVRVAQLPSEDLAG